MADETAIRRISETATKLAKLHAVITEFFDIREQLEQGPLQVQKMQKQIDIKKTKLAVLREELIELRKAADGKSLQLKTNEAKIVDLRTKLNAASSNRDFQIIKSQIEADEMANSVLEDEILEALDLVDVKLAAIANAEEKIKLSEVAQSTKADEVKQQAVVLQQQSVGVEASLVEAEKVIPASEGDMYRRLIKSHQAEALAPVEEKVCTSCFTMLTHQEIVNLNVGKFLFCRSCGKIIYNK
ncbi:hypothetical protein MNBD_PLANCTO02-2950 [hydrothermal vent metagenome]|uniref:C4-type zinc ribbon domain-containing protein n=1 Tax=hydrothermal vent metagenome TaxID=652676 RepID=A0A3B1DP53_9ZZZZ